MATETTSKSSFRKIYLTGAREGMRVPMKEVTLAPPNPPVRLYDTSGPYTDPSYRSNLDEGLPPLRLPWIEGRGDVVPTSSDGRRRRQIGRAHV